MNWRNIKSIVRTNLIPSVESQQLNACAYKRAKKQLSQKGFTVQPRVMIAPLESKRNAASVSNQPPVIILNSKCALEFFILPKLLKKIINHESRHFEQEILGKILEIRANESTLDEKLPKLTAKFYKENSKKTKLTQRNKERMAKIIEAKSCYPQMTEYFMKYNQIKNINIPNYLKPIFEPFKWLDLKINKFRATQKFINAHRQNYLEIEAMQAEKNNGSVFNLV